VAEQKDTTARISTIRAVGALTPGSDLLSHTVTSAVPSALEGLTSVFEMGTGVAPLALPPGILMMSKVKGASAQTPRASAVDLDLGSFDINPYPSPYPLPRGERGMRSGFTASTFAGPTQLPLKQ